MGAGRHSVKESAGQALCRVLPPAGSNGLLFRSVRYIGGECVACYRPKLVGNVRQGGHYEYRWEGARVPRVIKLDETPPKSASYTP